MTPDTCRWLGAALLPLALGFLAEGIACSAAGGCLGVALEFQPEGREALAAERFWGGALAYGAGVWLGFATVAAVPSLAPRRLRVGGRTLIATSGLGVLGGLLVVYAVTAGRWGVEVPTGAGGGDATDAGDGGPSTTRFVLEWPGPDHIPDSLEWWAMALLPWGLALGLSYYSARRRAQARPSRRASTLDNDNGDD